MKEDPDQNTQNDRPERELVVRNWQRSHPVDVRGLKEFLREVADAVSLPAVGLTVALVGDTKIRKMNHDFRGFDKPTDVLSFRSGPQGRAGEATADETGYLGDIVISVETAFGQAKRRGSLLSRELRVLTLHGLLHLLGYDHESDDGEMRRVEYRLRRRFQITTPRRLSA